MVNKADIRIGNLIYGVSDRIETIEELLSVYVETSFRGGLLHYSNYEDISGIELTPEILENAFKPRYSFEYTNASSCWVSIDNFILRFECFSKGDVFYMVNQMQMRPVKFVHSLQNLIYDLTGKELEITDLKRINTPTNNC